ncbi:uncharacterized protein LOC143067274 isoform X4 [Mytilus galloprovincialis]|uniref:uncharacterized protein LOC143067274 isoform X2 n=1 Tax=Mytilus galloprovincialis TaxID=29158 RepID=UPI003F7BE6D7
MKANKYGFELEQRGELQSSNSILGSQYELIGEKKTKKPNNRLRIGLAVVFISIVILIVVLVVVFDKDESNNSGGSSAQDQGKHSTSRLTSTTTNPQPTTDHYTTSTKQPDLTTTDPGQDWLKEPCQPQQAVTCPWKSNPVLLISLDGFRAEYLTRNLTPTLQRLTSCGVHTPYMRAVYPTLTFPNHYTIVTGLYPESHGIVDNNMYDPVINEKFSIGGSSKENPAWWGGEPIWSTAKKQGKKTATYFWVGSEVNISGIMPDIYYPYDGSVTFEDRVDKALEWLSWPENKRPDLITLYFNEPDHTGHGNGPVSPEVDAMLGRVDGIINRLMNGLYRRQIHNCVNLMVLADHGMESTSCDRRVYLNQYMNTSHYLIFDGTIGQLHTKFHEEKVGRSYVVKETPNPLPLEEVKKLLHCKSGHIQMFDKTTMPVRHHYTNNQRLGDVILDMQNRWTVARNSRSYCLKGNHGFDNLYKSMQALFVAHGPDFRQGIESDPFENIELYNLMCELLKISPAPNNGTMGSLNHLLRRPPAIPTTNRTMSPVCSHNKEDSIPDRNCYCGNKVKSFTSTTVYSSPFGKPEMSVTEDVCILSTNDTASGYSKTHKMPVWTSFILYPNKTVDNMTGSCVNIDPRVQLLSCSSYRNDNMSISHHFIVNSGFSVKNSDLEKTLSSSLVPMYDGFRDGIWEYTMKLILDYGNQRSGMEVIIGSAFDNNRDGLWEDVSNETKYVGKDGVPVPTHYYIIIISCKHGDILNCITTDLELLSFILPHLPAVPNCMPDEDYLMENVARIRDIELLTGIQFLTGLPDDTAASLRTFLPTSLWKPSKMSLHWKDVPCSAPSNSKCHGKIPLILISLDGFRADYVQRKLTPVIEKLRTCGLHTPYMRSVYPTVTFPNHYTIATGLYPESHGIISNNMYDADIGEVFSLSSHTKMDPRWWGGEPIWNTAKKQGRKAYTFFWPGSDVNISGSYPDVWVGYDGKIGFPERLEKVTEWLLLPDDKKPDIITLYFDEPDHAGHQKGPDGEMLNGQLETVDDMLGRLMNTLYQEGLHDCVNLIVIADHGMQHVSCSNMVKLPQYMPDDMKNILVFDGTFGRIENDYARISKYKVKTENFTQVPVSKITDELMCKNPAMKVFTKETAPKRFHYLNNKRIGDVLLDMQDQWLVTDTNTFWCTGGNHGWDNLYKSMHALFLAHGPAFKQQLEIKPFENIELYNLMCEISGIKPAPNNGTVGALNHILNHPNTIPHVTASQIKSNVTKPIPLCGCDSKNINLPNTVPDSTRLLPFGIPVSLYGTLYTKLYKDLASGYNDNRTFWATVAMPQTQGDVNSTKVCYVNDLSNGELTCDDYVNKDRNISLQTLYSRPVAGDNFLSSAVPMFDGFKNGIWEYVWQLSRDYSQRYGNMSVTTGPIYDYNGDGLVDVLFDSQSTVNSNSAVILPTHFFMILIKCKNKTLNLPCNGDIDVQSYILPHVQSVPNCLYNLEYLKDNVARIRDIELLTGIQFLTENIDQAVAAQHRTYLPVNLWPSELTETWLDKPCPSQPETCNSDYQPLILLSLDGFRADYLLRNFTPYIKKLSQCGVHAPYMRSVYPTKTFPNHYSIVTGLYPESHGVIDNNMYDESIGAWFGMSKPNASDPRWWKGEPIWNTAKKNNKKSATYFWPGSDVQIQGMYPDIWKKYDGKIPFDSRVDELLRWVELPAGQRPDFMTLYFDEPDHTGHSVGPDDIPKIGQALDKVDEAVGRLMEGLYRRNLHNCANIIIVADHGMSDTSCDRLITVRDYITEYNNMYVYEGAFSRINPKIKYGRSHPRSVPNPVPVANIIANMSCKTPHMKVYNKLLLPKRHHYANSPRIADIIVDVEDKWLFTYRALKSYNKRFCVGGNHGYDNMYKSMNALFLAHGPSFKQNLKVEPFENIELYNLMSVIMNITAAPNNGTKGSLNQLLRQPPVTITSLPSSVYNKTITDTIDTTVSPECLKRCPAFRNINKSAINRKRTETRNTPLGIPVMQTYPRLSVDLLYQPSHITGYDRNLKSPAWISYTIGQNSTTSKLDPGCLLPDKRTNTISDDKSSCVVNSNLPNNFTWASFMVSDDKEAAGYNSLSSLFLPVYKGFYMGIWSKLKEKVHQWSVTYREVNIIAGPAYDYDYDGHADTTDILHKYIKKFYGNNTDIAIPSHLFLIVTRCDMPGSNLAVCSSLKTMSFILPNIQHENNCQNTEDYLTDNEARLRDVELLTGLQFYMDYKNSIQLRTFLPHGLWSV